ncbi:MAG: isoleucine--tRNA ligase [Bacillota bacterium]|jgi:isoleucyl-tRNA synthetase
MEYGNTLNLPQTEFPMRGNLPQREPELLSFWQSIDIYKLVNEKNKGKPAFILHDGPPYANGDIHLGHVLNKVLKDMVVKYKSMNGFNAPLVPGWDTHGLPIELKTIKDLRINRHQVDKVEFRERCKGYALKYVDIQREQFKRIGVRADWDHPYVTLDPEYEAVQIGAFGEMAKKGYVYKGLKPVYWCPDCETALAEAEVEYADHKSASIYVKFAVQDGKGILDEDTSFVIWTTTPWTIPANLAICLHPEYDYVLLQGNGEKFIVARDLVDNFWHSIGRKDTSYTVLAQYKGRDLEYITCRHPLLDRKSLVILGNHVTLEAGTGCVHTAPGHGMDDFFVGRQYDLDILSPLDNKGCFTEEAGPFKGLDTKKGNKAVVKALEEAGALLHFNMFSHQYPHCWRCKTPILFRATEQWFASIDGFREKALEAVDNVRWIPAWGHDRIYNMIRDRGDWCISRQRTWGVPIPIFYCLDCGKPIINDQTIAHLQELFREHGSSIWFAKEAHELIPEGLTCPTCSSQKFTKETDIMDVWFDSGISNLAVLEHREGHQWPADLYLEGSDQHRGWFNSSLCISVATRGVPPYKQVLTHGFLVDEKGYKLSKSKGNAVDPLKVIDNMGADVLRLWVASADYRNDMVNSPQIMKQVSESYRKIRNTARYLLGNLYDFDINKNMVTYADMSEIDRWAMIKLHKLIERVNNAYENYEFHIVYHAIHNFCVVDMSTFYLDVVKDCLYTELPNDPKRRSVQTVLYYIADALVRLLTPVLAFTSEEIFSFLPKNYDAPPSVQLLDFPQADQSLYDDKLETKWQTLLEIRDQVGKELELARQDKLIGHSLDAAVDLYANADNLALLNSLSADLAKIFIVSQVNIKSEPAPAEASGNDDLRIVINVAKGQKCERCWIYSETVGEDKEHTTLCSRCSAVIKNMQLDKEE